MHTVEVDLAERSYPIYIGEELLSQPGLLNSHLNNGKVLIVSNETVAPLYLQALQQMLVQNDCNVLVLPDGEEHKNLDAVNRIYDILLQRKYDRQSTLIALGGGVVGDITGFAAATYQRGVNFIQIPTTLLSQVDSSVGGKTGVNHPLGKNMIGAFYQPQCVVADTAVLKTLPVREIKAGLAEVLKYGLINDPAFFHWLAANATQLLALDSSPIARAIESSCRHKADIVAQDEREGGVRALLNLGHTFGHAIETASGYGVLLHGEAVAIGIVMAADLSMRLGWIPAADALLIKQTFQNFGMPVTPPADITQERYLDLMQSDKKARQGKIRFILMRALGQSVVADEVDQASLLATLTAGEALCQPPSIIGNVVIASTTP